MTQKEITLCGKHVTLAYCYATEIGYKILSDEDITAFVTEAVAFIQQERMPDTRKSVFLILSAMKAYYDSRNEQTPIDDKAIMYEATPAEFGNAVGTVLGLRAEFYHVPSDEPKDKPEDREHAEKNA